LKIKPISSDHRGEAGGNSRGRWSEGGKKALRLLTDLRMLWGTLKHNNHVKFKGVLCGLGGGRRVAKKN